MPINYPTELTLAPRSQGWLQGGWKGAFLLVELLSRGGAGLFLEAQGHNLGEGPAPGSKQHSLVMIKWEAGLFDLSAPSGTPPDAFQQNRTCTAGKKPPSWSFLGRLGSQREFYNLVPWHR